MGVVVSAVLGAITSLVPEVLSLMKKKEDYKYQLALQELSIKKASIDAQTRLEVSNIQADVDEGKSLRDHDSTLDGGVFLNGLRASVRPVITYCFFLLFVFVKIVGVILIFKNNGGFIDLSIAWTEVYPLVWGMDEKDLFAAVMGFWFGSRAIDQSKRKRG
jgi:hypothetical protein